MKKLFVILITVFFANVCISQTVEDLVSDVSETVGADLRTQIQKKEAEIKNGMNGRSELKIVILPIKNEDNETTLISIDLAKKLSNVIQQDLKQSYSRFNSMTIVYMKNKGDILDCDFILTANYTLNNTQIEVNRIFLQHFTNSSQIALKTSSLKLNTELLRANDFSLVSANIEQLARAITAQFVKHEGLRNVKLNNFVSAENRLPSQFSEYLAIELETKFAETANIDVERNLSRGLNESTQYEINGTYRVENNRLKISAVLQDPESNTTKASATAYINKEYFKNNNISYEPPNEEIIDDRIEVLEDSTENNYKKGIQDNEFEVDVWTNKGNENVVFKEGEILTITVFSSQACYIRLIDIFADGTAILLLDNFEITDARAGRNYQIPTKFECASPFGAETIILSAQTKEKFTPLNTVNYYGYDKITDNLETILDKSRGFIPMVQKAEKYMHLVTIPK